jgi:AbiV family abortive infection protein
MTVFIKLDDIPMGVKLSKENAKGLLEEANLLYQKDFYARSAALAILSLEEIAKATFLRDRWIKGKDIPISFWDKKIIKHLPKARKGMSLSIQELINMMKGKVHKTTQNAFAKVLFNIATNSEAIREGCIYVDWKAGQWIDPKDGKYAQQLVQPIGLNEEETASALAVLLLHLARFALSNFEKHPDTQNVLSVE